jgi:ubiquinone/menaquinone biosynthesis C-methylase UbiE
MHGVAQTIKRLRSEGIEGYFAFKYAQISKDRLNLKATYTNVVDRVAAVTEGGTFLEVNSGLASVSIEIARRIPRAHIVGLETSETMIVTGRRNVAEAGLSERITLLDGCTVAMPFEDAKFDFVVSFGSFHQWSKPIEVLEEIFRVLKPDKEKIDEFSRHIRSWFMRWSLKYLIGKSYMQKYIEEVLRQTPFKRAYRIKLDDIGIFIWLQKPASESGR